MFDEKEFTRICEEGTELMLYFVINELGGFSWQMRHSMAHGRIPAEKHMEVSADVTRAQEQLKTAVGFTTRFGVETPTNEKGGPTEDYWKWFRWWDGHIKGLSREEWNNLDQALSAKEDVSQWMPEGSWNDA